MDKLSTLPPGFMDDNHDPAASPGYPSQVMASDCLLFSLPLSPVQCLPCLVPSSSPLSPAVDAQTPGWPGRHHLSLPALCFSSCHCPAQNLSTPGVGGCDMTGNLSLMKQRSGCGCLHLHCLSHSGLFTPATELLAFGPHHCCSLIWTLRG